MLIRLYVPTGLAPDGRALLQDGQAHYLRAVMRKAVGDRLLVFNSEDGEFDACLESLSKKGGSVRVGACRRPPVQLSRLRLLFAPTKKGGPAFVVQKAAELGVTHLQPVITARTTVARLRADRLAAIAIEATEQCERLSPPHVGEPMDLGSALAGRPDGEMLIFCDEAGDDDSARWGGAAGRAPAMVEAISSLRGCESAAILIGPEGGFTPQERAALRAAVNAVPVSLGPRILRADTAAVVALALWQAVCGDL